jgi:hypothetical protein
MLTEDQARDIRDLVESPGWKLLADAIAREASPDRYLDALELALTKPDGPSRDDIFARAVWERRALRIFLGLPHRWLADTDKSREPQEPEPLIGRRA